MDAIAESRADFDWFYNPYPLLLKIPVLQNETIRKPDDHVCRGRAGRMPVRPKDSARIAWKRAAELALQVLVPCIPTQLQVSGQTRPVPSGGDSTSPALERPCSWSSPQHGHETADVLAAAGCLALWEPGLEESSQLPPDGADSGEASGRLREEVR